MNFDSRYIDVAFRNGVIITVDDNDYIAEAIGIKGDKIVFVGSDQDLEKIISQDTKIIDLYGRSLLPGFVDSHYHPIFFGLKGPETSASIIDIGISQCSRISDILDKCKAAIALKQSGEWISMQGYDPANLLEQRHPTIDELDEISPNNPVQCMHIGGHLAVYNTRAIKLLGVYRPEDVSKYPKDEIDVVDGKLTGLLRENTNFKLWGMINYSKEAQQKAALKANDHLLENGITSIHDCGACDAPSYHIMQQLCKSRTFKVRSYMMLHSIYGKSFAYDDNEHLLALGFTTGLGDKYFRLGSCKFMLDGGSSAPSCATREPYSHDPNLPGVMAWEKQEIIDYIAKINNAGCQATAHAIGDYAIECMVEGYEKAFETNPRPDLRHRIEHCSIVDPNLVERIAKLNICPTLNPGMIQIGGQNYEKFYGERIKYIVALRSMLDAGIKVSIASDTPSGPAGIQIIDGAVNRYDRLHNYQVDTTQAISVMEAIRCATINGAYASFEDQIKGSLEVGKLADIIVLSDNILTYPKERINELKVDITMIDGNIEFVRSGQVVA